MTKRILARGALCAFDAFSLTALCLILIAGTPAFAFAYVDPSVMTYTIQALAGVAVALSTVLGVVYRRVRKHVVRILGIDENAGKVVDPDVVRVDGDNRDAENEKMGAFWKAAPLPGQAKDLTFPSRLWRAAIVSLFAVGTLLWLGPIELVAANMHSLTYNLGNVWAPITVLALIVAAIVTLIVAALPKRAFDIACAVVGALGVCFWIQALVLNVGLPSANGAPVEWSSIEYAAQTYGGALVWIAIIAALVFLAITQTKTFRQAAVGVSSVFFVIVLIGAGTIFADPQTMSTTRDGRQVYVTQEGIRDLAPQDNIVVFVLDMYDTNKFLEVYEQRPHVLDEFTGFTFFPDSTGSVIPTKYALPYLVTGTFPDENETWGHYLDTRYERSTFMADLHNAGYNLGIYTDTMGWHGEWHGVAQQTINQHPLVEKDSVDVDWWGAATIMAKVAMYRDLPWLLKPGFWYYTDDINIAMTPGGIDNLASTPYILNDQRFHDSFMENPLEIVDRGGKGSFRMMHLNGAHFPYTMQSDMTVSGGSTYVDQAEGALNIVRDYMRQMKELGIYDSATIIVTSDHGEWQWGHDDAPGPTTPILFIKPAQSHEEATAPVKTSDAQTGHCDFHGTIMTAATGDGGKYGISSFDAPTSGRERYFCYTLHDGHRDYGVKKYVITGNVNDMSGWTPVHTWEADIPN